MKAHGIHQSQTSTIDTIRNATIPTKRKSSHTVSKKRKLAQYSETNANTDDDEGPLHVKAEGGDCKFKIKPVKCEKVKRVPIKCERVKSEQLKEEPSVKEETDERVKEEPKIKVDGSAPTVVKVSAFFTKCQSASTSIHETCAAGRSYGTPSTHKPDTFVPLLL